MDFVFRSLKFKVYGSVYRPSDDSLMLAEHARALKGEVLDVGTGCGIAAITNASANPENKVVGVDINHEAVLCAEKNAERNGITNVKFFESDLFSALCGERFGFILFNPPYLPTKHEEKLKGGITAAFDGGKDGREVLDRLLSEFEGYLAEKGTLLLIQSSLNNPEKTAMILKERGFRTEILEKQDFFFEKIFLYRATRS